VGKRGRSEANILDGGGKSWIEANDLNALNFFRSGPTAAGRKGEDERNESKGKRRARQRLICLLVEQSSNIYRGRNGRLTLNGGGRGGTNA